jgi:hypothetical protein
MFLGIVNNDEILVARDKLDKANSFSSKYFLMYCVKNIQKSCKASGRAVIEHIIEQLIKHVNNEEKK